jgi:hypothetical protein
MMKKPIFLNVRFGQLRPWDKNPRQATEENVKSLAAQLKEVGIFKNFVCWQEGDDEKNKTYTVGGGNIRLVAMRELLGVGPEEKVNIAVCFPETEAEKVRISLLDNMTFGSYVEQQLAELTYGFKDDPALAGLRVNFSYGVDLKEILDSVGPSAPLTEKELSENVETSMECPRCGYKW